VEVRARSLRQIHQLWTEADTERDRLASWLAGVEKMLRNVRDSVQLRVSVLVLSRLKGSVVDWFGYPGSGTGSLLVLRIRIQE
jgi:hypothetical protein